MEIELFPFVYIVIKIDIEYLPAALYFEFFCMIVRSSIFGGLSLKTWHQLQSRVKMFVVIAV